MRTKLFRVIAGAALLVATAAPVIAHHSFAAEFDANKPVKIKGHGRQGGVDQPAHVDPHRGDGSGREGGALGGRRWRAERADPPRLDQELAARRHRDHRRRLPGEGRFATARTAVTSPSRTGRSCSSARRAPARRRETGAPVGRSGPADCLPQGSGGQEAGHYVQIPACNGSSWGFGFSQPFAPAIAGREPRPAVAGTRVENAAFGVRCDARVDSLPCDIRQEQATFGCSRDFGDPRRSTRPMSLRLAFTSDADHASSTRRRARSLGRLESNGNLVRLAVVGAPPGSAK